jgi:superfamily I DNA/RNA helicase
MAITLTVEQEKVHTAFENRINAAIKAYAGSGKSTTIIGAFKNLPRNVKGLLIYFNKAARKEAELKLAGYNNIKVCTNHTFAFAAVGKDYANANRIVGGKGSKRYSASDVASLFGLTDYQNGDVNMDAKTIAQWAMMTTRKFASSTDREINEYNVPWIPAYDESFQEMKPIVTKVAREIWADKCDRSRGVLPVEHDDYLKMWAMSKSSWFFGRQVIAIDEFQDTNPVMWDVFRKHTSATLYGIGDPYQSVYGFRGAKNYLDEIGKLTKGGVPIPSEMLYLTKTHRFGGEVVDWANMCLEYAGADLPLVGNELINSTVTDFITDPDAILCRTNAGVIAAAIGVAASGRTFSIANIDAIKSLAEGALQLYSGVPSMHQDLMGISSWDHFVNLTENDPSFSDLKVLAKLITEHGAQSLIDLVNSAKPEGQAECAIMTAHRVKGLEWKRVQIAGDFSLREGSDGKLILPTMTDIYLAYVAITRAIECLGIGSLDYVQSLDTLTA